MAGGTFVSVTGRWQKIQKSFQNVEELLEYCDEFDYGVKTARHTIREYLASPQVLGASASVQTSMRTAIKSYFGANDVVLDIPRHRKRRSESEAGSG